MGNTRQNFQSKINKNTPPVHKVQFPLGRRLEDQPGLENRAGAERCWHLVEEASRTLVRLGSQRHAGQRIHFNYFNLCFLSHIFERKVNSKYLEYFILTMQPNVMILIFCKDRKKTRRVGSGGGEQGQLWGKIYNLVNIGLCNSLFS